MTAAPAALAWAMKHEPAVEVEHHRGPVGTGLVPCELGADEALGREAQPVAVERQGPVELSYRASDGRLYSDLSSRPCGATRS